MDTLSQTSPLTSLAFKIILDLDLDLCLTIISYRLSPIILNGQFNITPPPVFKLYHLCHTFAIMSDITKNRSVKQIQTDRKFDKKHEEHVSEGGRRLVCFSLRGNDVIISGEDSAVKIVEDEDITIKELKNKLKAMGEPEDKGHNLKYIQKKSARLLPTMCVKIGGKKWSIKTGRIQVTEFMTELGYGRCLRQTFLHMNNYRQYIYLHISLFI